MAAWLSFSDEFWRQLITISKNLPKWPSVDKNEADRENPNIRAMIYASSSLSILLLQSSKRTSTIWTNEAISCFGALTDIRHPSA